MVLGCCSTGTCWGDGVHTLVVRADGVEFGRATFTVTTLGEEFVRGVMGETVAMDFPDGGTDERLVWEQGLQNFMLAPPEGNPAARPARATQPAQIPGEPTTGVLPERHQRGSPAGCARPKK